MPVLINKEKKVYGSVAYLERRTGDMVLEFFTSSLNSNLPEENKLEYP